MADLDYLMPSLRLTIGDINPAAYRYTDEWLSSALYSSMYTMLPWFKYKYTVDSTTLVVTRNPENLNLFVFDEPPVIELQDERPIILMAAIIVLEGSLENYSWNLASWRDAEISYTNLDSGRIKSENLKRLWAELNSLILPPTKRLAKTVKGSLPGYINNPWERKGIND